MKIPPDSNAWTRNLGLKVLSVILAAGVWLYVNSQGQVTVNFSVPIEPVHLGADLVLGEMDQDAAQVRLTGRENVLARISARHLHAYLDLATAVAGEQWIPLGPGDVQVPELVEVTRVTPHQVRARLERRMTRTLPITADVVGQPGPGVRVVTVTVEPPEIALSGPESAFYGLNRLTTQPVDIGGIIDTVRREARLDLAGRRLERPEQQPIYVRITVESVGTGP